MEGGARLRRECSAEKKATSFFAISDKNFFGGRVLSFHRSGRKARCASTFDWRQATRPPYNSPISSLRTGYDLAS